MTRPMSLPISCLFLAALFSNGGCIPPVPDDVAPPSLTGCSESFDRLEPASEPLSQEEVQKEFTAIVARITKEMVAGTQESVTDLRIGDKDDPPDGPVTVHIAAVQWLCRTCCPYEPEDTPFYDADLALVSCLERIGKLTVNRTRITDAGLHELTRHSELTHLDLSSNQLTDEALRHIGRLKNLEVLNLSNTRITGAGLRHLGNLHRLRELTLNDAPLVDDALPHLSALKGLERLSLDSTPISGAGFARVRGLDRLEELSLNSSGVTSEGLAHLPVFPSLRMLAIVRTAIDDQGLAPLAKLEMLEVATLSHTQIGDAGLSHLRGLRKLRVLHANGTSITDQGLRHMATATGLETISLANTGVQGFGVSHLRDCLRLRSFHLGYSSLDRGIQADAETLETLNRFKGLRSLTLDLSHESSPSDMNLSGMPDLHLLLIRCGSSMGRIELSDMPDLRTLEIRGIDQPGYPSHDHGLIEAEVVPRIEEITLRNVGDAPSTSRLLVLTVLPQVFRLEGVGNALFREVTGCVRAHHAEVLEEFGVVRVNALSGSDPVAVAAMLAGQQRRPASPPYNQHVMAERWTRDWSVAFRNLVSSANHLTMHLARVDPDAPIDLQGMTELKFLTLAGISDSEKITLEGLPPGMRQVRLQDAELGTLVMRGCHAPIECRQVRRFNRLIAFVGPRKSHLLSIFGGGNDPRRKGFVIAPEVLELHDFQDVKVCSLRSGPGLKRVELYGQSPNFHYFEFVPSSVVEMTWEGHEAGRWQGEFFRR